MRYDARPMWEINGVKKMETNVEMEKTENIIKPKLQIWSKRRLSKSGTVSDLYNWYNYHDNLRREKKENEIDINEIKAALGGSRNRWMEVVVKNKYIFKNVLESKKYDWNKLMELLDTK